MSDKESSNNTREARSQENSEKENTRNVSPQSKKSQSSTKKSTTTKKKKPEESSSKPSQSQGKSTKTLYAVNGDLRIERTEANIEVEGEYFESYNLVVDGNSAYGPAVLYTTVDGAQKMLTLSAKEVQLLFKLLPSMR